MSNLSQSQQQLESIVEEMLLKEDQLTEQLNSLQREEEAIRAEQAARVRQVEEEAAKEREVDESALRQLHYDVNKLIFRHIFD